MKPSCIIRSISEESDGTANHEICIDKWPSDLVIDWQRIAARDLTTACTLIELYLKRGSNKYLLRASAQGALGRTVHLDTDVCAPGDFQVCALFSDPTDGDKLELYAFGVICAEGPPSPKGTL